MKERAKALSAHRLFVLNFIFLPWKIFLFIYLILAETKPIGSYSFSGKLLGARINNHEYQSVATGIEP